MPKVNVYLPDRLAEAVRAYGIPLSSVCQRALEQEVGLRMSVLKLTPRARSVLAAAAQEAEQLGEGFVGTEHLLLGLIAEGEGTAAEALESLGISESVRAKVLELIHVSRSQSPSNRCIDKAGNLVGYMLQDEEGTPFVVGRDGRPVHMRRNPDGSITVVDETGDPVVVGPADGAPRLVETDEEGNLVVLVDAEGNRLAG